MGETIEYMLRLTRSLSTKVHAPLSSDIREHITRKSWSVADLLSQDSPRCRTIDDTTIDKLVKLSGLSYDRAEYPKLIDALKEQVRFIDQLHSIDLEPLEEQSHTKPLSLSDIEARIEQQSQDPLKGEISGSWSPLDLATEKQNGHYVVREGLLKDK